MAIELPDTVTRLLDARNFAHLATIMSDGSPHCAPVWVGREGDRIIICTDEETSLADARRNLFPTPSRQKPVAEESRRHGGSPLVPSADKLTRNCGRADTASQITHEIAPC